MPRTARIAPKEHIYHLLTRGNNRQDVFEDEEDFRKYLDLLYLYKEKYYFMLYHYVMMTNHVHLVIEPSEGGGCLSEIMKGINLSYARHYKRKYGHMGHFWQDRYKSIIISKDEYLLACGSYVELNPVRSKMVEDPKYYRWSSYCVYGYGKKDILVDEHPIYLQLSEEEEERRKKYREFVRGMLKEKEAMKGEMDRRLVYGGEDFVKDMTKTYNISEKIKRMGRQRGWRKNKENRPL
ncbi:MAG: transposase [Deltaproteobacteria bacterium]|nr:transposase [Deltaproteobacteria bacterium]